MCRLTSREKDVRRYLTRSLHGPTFSNILGSRKLPLGFLAGRGAGEGGRLFPFVSPAAFDKRKGVLPASSMALLLQQ
jgi:hypothetical protein